MECYCLFQWSAADEMLPPKRQLIEISRCPQMINRLCELVQGRRRACCSRAGDGDSGESGVGDSSSRSSSLVDDRTVNVPLGGTCMFASAKRLS